ncbi:hypothetical protein [Acinetobacter sp. WZC-1]
MNAAIQEQQRVSLLDDYTISVPLFYLFYTSRRLTSPACKVIKGALTTN